MIGKWGHKTGRKNFVGGRNKQAQRDLCIKFPKLRANSDETEKR